MNATETDITVDRVRESVKRAIEDLSKLISSNTKGVDPDQITVAAIALKNLARASGLLAHVVSFTTLTATTLTAP